MKTASTMDDFHAEMRRRAKPSSVRADRCAACGGTDLVDAIDNDGQPYRGCARCRVTRGHAPRIMASFGCTCGWKTPPGATNSDDTYATHYAIGKGMKVR